MLRIYKDRFCLIQIPKPVLGERDFIRIVFRAEVICQEQVLYEYIHHSPYPAEGRPSQVSAFPRLLDDERLHQAPPSIAVLAMFFLFSLCKWAMYFDSAYIFSETTRNHYTLLASKATVIAMGPTHLD